MIILSLMMSEIFKAPMGVRFNRLLFEISPKQRRVIAAITINKISAPALDMPSIPLYAPYMAAASSAIGKIHIDIFSPELSVRSTVKSVRVKIIM